MCAVPCPYMRAARSHSGMLYVWMKLTSKSPMVNRVAASESAGGRSGLIIYVTHRHTFIDMVSNCVSVQSNTEMNF